MLAKILVSIAFFFLYWFCCFLGTGTDKKNLAGMRSYPDAVQQAVRKYPTLGKNAPQENPSYPSCLETCCFLQSCFLF